MPAGHILPGDRFSSGAFTAFPARNVLALPAVTAQPHARFRSRFAMQPHRNRLARLGTSAACFQSMNRQSMNRQSMNKAFDPHFRGFRASRTATRHAKEAYCILPGARLLPGVIGSSMIQDALPARGSWLLRNPRKWNTGRITAHGSTAVAFHRAQGESIPGRKAQLPLPHRGGTPPCTHSSPSAALGAWA